MLQNCIFFVHEHEVIAENLAILQQQSLHK